MKKEIKNYAVKNHIKNFKERCGLPSERIDTSILKEMSLLFRFKAHPIALRGWVVHCLLHFLDYSAFNNNCI